ncbi:uncharacterized protein JN550_000031 [Neoarthrinium moseri]|uniref:uncharacterized protein n=1 Tax=Neoarthrinium moseri TaxID=1658444 RepID=UPI001FDAFEEC|nr:uncharacterized protein JN550_000031 [Neoarthrinium moseri]KAI1877849.1 hypothetical protein JN550_000031 [Neoarthrinium moseri]
MPRPKRTRVASTRATRSTKQASPEPAPQHVPDANVETVDASEGGNTGHSLRRGTRRSSSRAASMTSAQASALLVSRKKRDSAMDRLENMTSTSTGNTNTADDDDDDIDDTESSIELEMGRRGVAATPAHGRLNEVSGLDMDDDMFDDLNTTFDDTAPPASALRSHDTSTLSISHFKRRPRAASFLSRDDGPLRPSSRAGPNTPGISSTFNIGVFKRRAREPSILGTAQKPRAERPVLQSETGDKSDEDPEEEEEQEQEPAAGDEFEPEAEGTPLRRSTRRSAAADANDEALQTSSVNPRKRKSTDAHQQRPRSSPYVENNGAAAEETEEEVLSSSPSLPRVLDALDRPTTPFNDEGIAPPESSGSESEADVWPPLQSLAKGRSRRPAPVLRRTPVRDDSGSDMSSPPSLTYSPNYGEPSSPPQRAARQTRRAASKSEPKITTADLQGLLPRRRYRSARNDSAEDSDAEVDTAGLGDDDDELSHLDVRTRRRPARPLSRAATGNQSATRGRSTQQKGKTPASANPSRTYGRSSDKENLDDEEAGSDAGTAAGPDDDGASENSEDMVARVGEELKNAARKFAEVDRWELEYEEVTQSSSPRDAR